MGFRLAPRSINLDDFELLSSNFRKISLDFANLESITAKRMRIDSYFLPARRYASAGNSDRNVSVRPSVRLSVCLSVTRRYCVKTKKASGMISSPSGSPRL